MRIIKITLMILSLLFLACENSDNPNGPDDNIPNQPSGLAAFLIASSQIGITWQDNSDNETGFEIERKLGENEWVVIDTTQDTTIFIDTDIAINHTYIYRIAAFNDLGKSNYSNSITATTSVPDAPVNLTATAISNTSIQLVWADSSDNESGFQVYRRYNGPWGLANIVNYDDTVYIDNNLDPGETYFYYVQAYNSIGNSTPTDTASATTLTSSLNQVGIYEEDGGYDLLSVAGNYAYMTLVNNYNAPDTLEIIDISTLSSPQSISITGLGHKVSDMFIYGDTAYFAAMESGFIIVDLSTPASPSLINTYAPDTLCNISQAACVDSFVFVLNSDSIEVYNVSNPLAPVFESEIDSFAFKNFEVTEDYLYCDDFSYVYIYDISDKQNLELISSCRKFYPVAEFGFYLHDDYLVVGGYGFQIYDISNTGSPFFANNIFDGSFDYTFAGEGNYLYVESHATIVYDISDISNILRVAYCRSAYNIYVIDNHLFQTTSSGLYIWEFIP